MESKKEGREGVREGGRKEGRKGILTCNKSLKHRGEAPIHYVEKKLKDEQNREKQ